MLAPIERSTAESWSPGAACVELVILAQVTSRSSSSSALRAPTTSAPSDVHFTLDCDCAAPSTDRKSSPEVQPGERGGSRGGLVVVAAAAEHLVACVVGGDSFLEGVADTRGTHIHGTVCLFVWLLCCGVKTEPAQGVGDWS